MAANANVRATAIQTALNAAGPNASDAVKQDIVAGVIGAPGESARSALWIILVVGLLTILLGSLGAIIWIEVDGSITASSDKIVTLFASVLTGLIGLFAPSPVGRGSN
jgi:hypothetical protein